MIFNLKQVLGQRKQSIQIVLLKLFIIGIFLPIKVSNATLFLLIAFWLVSGDYKLAPAILKKQSVLLLLLGLYALHIIGMVYTDNFYSAYKELEKKIPMLVLPVLIGSISHGVLHAERTRLSKFYMRVTAVACAILLTYAIGRYALYYDPTVFYYIKFSELITLNPIYLSMYVLVAISIYFYELHSDFPAQKLWTKIAGYFYTFLILILLSSKNSLLVFGLVTLHYIFTRVNVIKKRGKMIVAATLVVLSAAAINFFPVTRERIKDVFNSDWTGILRNDYTLNASTYTGLTLRVSFWKIAIKRMYEDKILFSGVGTGDATDYMNQAYKEYGLLDAGFLDYNLHNAFLEVFLEFGLAGLAYYLVLLACMIRFAILKRDQLLLLTLAVFISFSMTESVLNVNKGITFFFFFFSFLISTHLIPSQTKITPP